MFSTVKAHNENSIGTYDVGAVLKKTILELKHKFENIWRNYKDECDYIKRFHEKTVKIFLNKFEDYKCPTEIDKDFSESISHWEKNKENLEKEFFTTYKILLLIYQMYFLEMFTRRITFMNRQFLQLNRDDEKKINVDNIVQDVLSKYQLKLENYIFNNLDERLKHALQGDLLLLQKQVKQFNQAPVESYYPTDFQNNKLSNNEKLQVLMLEEMNQLKYRKKCKESQEELHQKKTQILQSNMHYVTELIDTVRTQKKIYPEIDLLQNVEYKLIYHQYVAMNHYIQVFILATNRLRLTLNEYKVEVEAYKKILGNFSKFLGYDMTGIFEECQKFIEKSRLLKTNFENVPLEIQKFSEILPQLKERNDDLEKKLSARFQEILTIDEKQKYYEESIQRKRKELLLYLTNIPEIIPPKNVLFENKKLELKKAWREWFILPENRKSLEIFLKLKRKEIEEEKYSGEQKNEIMRAIFVVAKKLKKFEEEFKNYPTEDSKPHAPFSFVNSISIQPILSANNNKYKFLVDKPWKRILLASLLTLAVLALCFTMWGAIAGLTFGAFILMIGGPSVFSAIVTTTFSFSLFSTISLECRAKCVCIPPDKTRDNDFSLRPSIKELTVEMPVTKSNTPFFRKKGAHHHNQESPVIKNVSQTNHR